MYYSRSFIIYGCVSKLRCPCFLCGQWWFHNLFIDKMSWHQQTYPSHPWGVLLPIQYYDAILKPIFETFCPIVTKGGRFPTHMVLPPPTPPTRWLATLGHQSCQELISIPGKFGFSTSYDIKKSPLFIASHY